MQPRAQQRRRAARPATNGSACVPRPSDASVANVSRYFYERDATAHRFPGTPHLGPHRLGRAAARAAARSKTLKQRLDGLERVQDVEVVNS